MAYTEEEKRRYRIKCRDRAIEQAFAYSLFLNPEADADYYDSIADLISEYLRTENCILEGSTEAITKAFGLGFHFKLICSGIGWDCFLESMREAEARLRLKATHMRRHKTFVRVSRVHQGRSAA